MLESKYVVFDRFHVVVVSPGAKHADAKLDQMKPTSAGFFNLFVNQRGQMEVEVYGESESLALSHGKYDAGLVKLALGIGRSKDL